VGGEPRGHPTSPLEEAVILEIQMERKIPGVDTGSGTSNFFGDKKNHGNKKRNLGRTTGEKKEPAIPLWDPGGQKEPKQWGPNAKSDVLKNRG